MVTPIATDDQIVEAMRELTAAHGYPPSVRELTAAVGMASSGSLQYRLSRLREAGRVTSDGNRVRTLRVVERTK